MEKQIVSTFTRILLEEKSLQQETDNKSNPFTVRARASNLFNEMNVARHLFMGTFEIDQESANEMEKDLDAFISKQKKGNLFFEIYELEKEIDDFLGRSPMDEYKITENPDKRAISAFNSISLRMRGYQKEMDDDAIGLNKKAYAELSYGSLRRACFHIAREFNLDIDKLEQDFDNLISKDLSSKTKKITKKKAKP